MGAAAGGSQNSKRGAERLSNDAQRLLLLVAADDSAQLSVVRAAARHLGIDPDALDEVERSGLVTVVEDQLELAVVGTNLIEEHREHPFGQPIDRRFMGTVTFRY